MQMLLLFVIVCLSTAADIDYYQGTLPVILSAPHGGSIVDTSDIPDRQPGCSISGVCTYQATCSPKSATLCPVKTDKDQNTTELLNEISSALQTLTGHLPFRIINNLHRKKLDANRPIDEAAEGISRAEDAWHEYHDSIEDARAWIQGSNCSTHGAFYIDVHGQAHTEQWIEWGYSLSDATLNQDDTYVNGAARVASSSLRRAVAFTGTPLATLIRGAPSWGTLAQSAGYKSVPSSTYPGPGTGNYFQGGFSLDTHTGGVAPALQTDGFQLEVNSNLRKVLSTRQAFAAWVAQQLVTWMDDNYNLDLYFPCEQLP